MEIAANIPMITMTISSSTIVKPLDDLSVMGLA